MLKANGVKFCDGIYVSGDYKKIVKTVQKNQWEKTAGNMKDVFLRDEAKGFGGVWKELPMGGHFDSILDVGCGYGRLALHLSKYKKITCKEYYAVDISENTLRLFLKYRKEYNFLPSTELYLICATTEDLPLDNDSVDLVVSNSVFMHLRNEQIVSALKEISRVVKQNSVFIFGNSFHNKYCLVHVLRSFLKKAIYLGLKPVYSSCHSPSEINNLLIKSGLVAKCPKYAIKPTEYPGLFPEKIKSFTIPLAKEINKLICGSAFLKKLFSNAYDVYSSERLFR